MVLPSIQRSIPHTLSLQLRMINIPIPHWPTNGTESVPFCPVCGCSEKTTLHAGLSDLTFNVAPGAWNMIRCNYCHSGYLDPRPTSETIELAYVNYYTHEDTSQKIVGLFGRLRRGIAESYANWRFGTHFAGQITMGHIFALFLPRLRRYLDVRYGRHLPDANERGSKRRLLDVGCGNGEFLACASAMGWLAEGIDVDPAAITAATAAGYSARQVAIDDPSLIQESYDQITLSHVIEHVAAPHEQLKGCFNLLAPGGRLWLQTPNIDSLGHEVFGAA